MYDVPPDPILGERMHRVMLVDYWIAGHLGRLWLRLGRRQGDVKKKIERCLEVSRGRKLPPLEMLDIHGYVMAAWIAIGGMAFLLVVASAFLLVPVLDSAPGLSFLVIIPYGLSYLIFLGLMEVAMNTVRCRGVVRYVRAVDPARAIRVMERGSGVPKPRDFWLNFAIVALLGSFIQYISLSS